MKAWVKDHPDHYQINGDHTGPVCGIPKSHKLSSNKYSLNWNPTVETPPADGTNLYTSGYDPYARKGLNYFRRLYNTPICQPPKSKDTRVMWVDLPYCGDLESAPFFCAEDTCSP